MKVQIQIKEINADYSQKYAEQYQFGKESESNQKYNWARGGVIDKVKSVEFLDNTTWSWINKAANGPGISISIPNVAVFKCHLEDGNTLNFVVSVSLINKTHQRSNAKSNKTYFYFYINSTPPSISNDTGNILLNVSEVPKELKVYSKP